MIDKSIFDRFDLSDDTLKYRFDIYQYGHFVDSRYFHSYSSAQAFFASQYCKYESGEKVFINDEELSFLEAYQFFNVSEYNQRHWGKI